MLYDDGRIACDENSLIIRWYYFPWGEKTIAYRSIKSVNQRTISRWQGKWRIWGSGDFRHWWNLDGNRPNKDLALEIDVGGHYLPTITPDDPATVERILNEHIAR